MIKKLKKKFTSLTLHFFKHQNKVLLKSLEFVPLERGGPNSFHSEQSLETPQRRQ